MPRQSDIQVFVRSVPASVVGWLESVAGPLGDPQDGGAAIIYTSAIGPVIVTPDMQPGDFIGIWFNTQRSPWATDVDCAREAAVALGCAVRCDPGSHFPEVPPQSAVFLEIHDGCERLVTWC